MQKDDLFQIKIGDTERNISEIITSIHHSDLPITHIQSASKTTDKLGAGAILTLHVTPDTLSEEQLKHQLNEYGACMYQIESVVKAAK